MAISFRGGSTNSVINGGVLSITLSGIAGLAQDDVVVAFCMSSGGTGATPAGWTNIKLNQTLHPDSVCYKVMGASPDASVSFWDTGTTSDSGIGVALAFTGVDTANVQDATAAFVGTLDPASVTPVHDNAAIIVFSGEVGTTVDTTHGSITNFTVFGSPSASDTNSSTGGGAYNLLSGGAGVGINPAAWSLWSSTNDVGTWTVALRELVAVGQPYDLHEGGVQFVNPVHNGGYGLKIWRKAGELLLPPKRQLIWV